MITRLLRDPIRLINRAWFGLGLPEIIWPNAEQRIARELEKDAIRDVMTAALYADPAVKALDVVGRLL